MSEALNILLFRFHVVHELFNSRPIFGTEEIYNLFTQYRDAIQYIFDQTIRYMNKGLHPDEIAATVSCLFLLQSMDYKNTLSQLCCPW